jgi:hypothetical protein
VGSEHETARFPPAICLRASGARDPGVVKDGKGGALMRRLLHSVVYLLKVAQPVRVGTVRELTRRKPHRMQKEALPQAEGSPS